MHDHQDNQSIYRLIRFFGAPFRFDVEGLDHIGDTVPSIFAANHLGSIGPIATILSMPMRFHPWVIGDMLDHRRGPAYLYDDFVRPAWKLEGRVGMLVSTVISRIAIRLLNGLGSVPVERDDARIVLTFRRSLYLLRNGKHLLIFPEDGKLPVDPETGMRPFTCNFIGLCYLYARETGRQLPVYPLAVHAASRRIAVGQAVYCDGDGDRRQQIDLTCCEVRDRILDLYRGLNRQHH